MLLKVISLLLFFLPFMQSVKSQVVAVSQEINMLKNMDYDILGLYNEMVLMAQISDTGVEIQSFDNNLYSRWKKDLKFDSKKIYINDVFPGDTSFSVIYTDIGDDFIGLKIATFDSNADPLDTVLVKVYEKGRILPRFKITSSEDRNYLAIHHMKAEGQLEVLFYSVTDNQIVADHLYDVTQFDFRRNFKTIFLSNQGELFIVLDNTLNVTRHTSQLITVIRSSISSNIPIVIDKQIIEYALSNVIYLYDNQNRQLVVTGLYSEKIGSESMGAFSLYIPNDKSKAPSPSFIPYTTQLLMDFKTGRKGKDDVIPNLQVQDVIMRMDGGVILIAENRKEYERSLYQGRRDFYSMRFAIDYYYEDLILIAINPDGTDHWQKLLQKKQYSFDDDALYSSFFVFKNPSSVRLLYNDEIRNENTVSEYIITGGGKHERRSLLNTNRQDLKLQIRNSLQITSSEIIIPSIKRNKLKLVKVNYLSS